MTLKTLAAHWNLAVERDILSESTSLEAIEVTRSLLETVLTKLCAPSMVQCVS